MVIGKPRRPEKPPKEPKAEKPPRPPKPEPTPSVSIGDPRGAIGGPLQIAYGRGGDWSLVNRYDPSFLRWGAKYGVDPAMLKAMAVIESGGQMIPNAGGSGAAGIMQIKNSSWGWLANQLGADLNTPDGQVAVAAAILGQYGTGSTPEERFLASYYPTPGLDVPGEDGHTPRQYLADMHELMRQINAADTHGTTPAPKPQPTGDVLDLVFGGKPYEISATYGQLVTWECPGCYDYFAAYGLDTRHHWAYDCVAAAQDGAPLYAPFAGTVVCAGTDIGSGAWGTGCSAFGRVNNYGGKPSGAGAGRLELLHADGDRSLILGHVLSSRVRAGDRVKAGDLIGQQGGMNGSHVHCEARYANGTRIGDPRKLFGGGPLPTVYAERVPMDWSDPNLFAVYVARDGVRVQQRADPGAPDVAPPLKKGESFFAVAIIAGNDGQMWWLSATNGRVPKDGTEAT